MTSPYATAAMLRAKYLCQPGPRAEAQQTNTILWTAPGDPSAWSPLSPVKRTRKPRSYQFLNWWMTRKHLGLNPSDRELARFLRQRSWRRLI